MNTEEERGGRREGKAGEKQVKQVKGEKPVDEKISSFRFKGFSRTVETQSIVCPVPTPFHPHIIK